MDLAIDVKIKDWLGFHDVRGLGMEGWLGLNNCEHFHSEIFTGTLEKLMP